jgi:hypothetical protein
LLAALCAGGRSVGASSDSSDHDDQRCSVRDGTLAGGTLLISWPTFSTPAGQAVAAGRIFVGEPGRVKLAEDRITRLERSEIRRGVYDRMVSAVITVAISAAIAMYDR